MKWMFQKHAPLSIRPDGSLFQLRWMAAMLKNCSAERYAVNKELMMRVAEYSRTCLRQLRADTGIAYAFLASNAAGPSPASNQVTVTVR